MLLDGARSATRMEQGGVTRGTRATFDFQARDNFELRAGNLQRIFMCLLRAERWPTTPLPPNNYHPPSLVNVH
jgi:hypothetical protein